MINSIQGNNPIQNNGITANSRSYVPEFKLRPDVVSINKPMSEYMTKKTVGMFNPSLVFGGVLNGNPAELVVNSEKFGFGVKNAKGNINGQNIELTYQNKTYQGLYGENEFNLKLKKADLLGGTRYITGTINGEEVEFDLKNSKLPKDSETQNIIASVLLLNGESAKVRGEEFNGTKRANWVIQEENEAAMMVMMAPPPGCGI